MLFLCLIAVISNDGIHTDFGISNAIFEQNQLQMTQLYASINHLEMTGICQTQNERQITGSRLLHVSLMEGSNWDELQAAYFFHVSNFCKHVWAPNWLGAKQVITDHIQLHVENTEFANFKIFILLTTILVLKHYHNIQVKQRPFKGPHIWINYSYLLLLRAWLCHQILVLSLKTTVLMAWFTWSSGQLPTKIFLFLFLPLVITPETNLYYSNDVYMWCFYGKKDFFRNF